MIDEFKKTKQKKRYAKRENHKNEYRCLKISYKDIQCLVISLELFVFQVNQIFNEKTTYIGVHDALQINIYNNYDNDNFSLKNAFK